MCAAAMNWAQLEKLVYGAGGPQAGIPSQAITACKIRKQKQSRRYAKTAPLSQRLF